MGKSFRKTSCGHGRKPFRGIITGYIYKIKRASRRKMNNFVDEEGQPILPKKIGNKWPNGTFDGYVRNFNWGEESIDLHKRTRRTKRKYISLKGMSRFDSSDYINSWYK